MSSPSSSNSASNTAVDDYGTGTLSLSQPRHIAVDLLKIDCFLVRNMLSDRPSRDVVELLLTLGHQWKIHVLAQGIERPSQCETLKELGCCLGQGYLFSPPSPPKPPPNSSVTNSRPIPSQPALIDQNCVEATLKSCETLASQEIALSS